MVRIHARQVVQLQRLTHPAAFCHKRSFTRFVLVFRPTCGIGAMLAGRPTSFRWPGKQSELSSDVSTCGKIGKENAETVTSQRRRSSSCQDRESRRQNG